GRDRRLRLSRASRAGARGAGRGQHVRPLAGQPAGPPGRAAPEPRALRLPPRHRRRGRPWGPGRAHRAARPAQRPPVPALPKRMTLLGQMSAPRSGYATTPERGLRWESVPMRLGQKAKRLGVWDPAAIDLAADREHWARFGPEEREFILRTIAL